MNRIVGKVLVKESGYAVPDVLISLYDVGHDNASDQVSRRAQEKLALSSKQIQGTRLGSVLTDENGKFELAYEDSKEKRHPDLVLVVSAPEQPGMKDSSSTLFISSRVREKAGQTETYLLRLPAAQLKKADVHIPGPASLQDEEPDMVVKKLIEAETRRLEIHERLKTAIAAKRVDTEREFAVEFKQTFRERFLNALSKVPEDVRQSPTYVAPGQSVVDQARSILRTGILQVVNRPEGRAPVSGYIILSDEERRDLAERASGLDRIELSSEETLGRRTVHEILFGARLGTSRPSFVLRKDLLAQVSEKSPGERILEQSTEATNGMAPPQPNGAPAAATGTGVQPATPDGVLTYVARLLNDLTPPEDPVAITVPERATQEAVQNRLDAFRLRSGPADTPAFYDFVNLQIAFDHVWQELFDKNLLELIQAAAREIRRLGGVLTPHIEPYANILEALRSEARSVLNAGVDLEESRVSLRLTRRDQPPPREPEPRKPEDKDKQSEPVPVPGTSDLPGLIKELDSQLEGPYVFTVYAPNSVNLGVLVTYRQKWEPISYQVGELLKTIPLAPKEVRKFSKKLVMRKTRKDREVENSLRSRRDEASETSRVETDILQKAQRKTNFSLTAEGGFQLEIASGKTTTSLGNEASVSSEEVKKDFREAVFKATEEYKQERTLEINTEGAEESETVESGEITNPNDELAVTFLFYELQRRYRISEKIHRLTPVILVAQEVPKPEEIDDAWLIAHDWILRRVLLDDTFQPALVYLSTKIVGEEWSLNELKRNVEDQRKLVEKTQDQVAAVTAQRIGEYSALQNAVERYAQATGGAGEGVGERIGEAIVTGGLSEIFDFFDGGGNDENKREAARIRREAARDVYENALKEEKDLCAKLEREVTALQAMTETYTKALSEYWNRRVQVGRLRVHIKQNILYYMQAVWSHEPSDQRFFRLHQIKAPQLQARNMTYSIRTKADSGAPTAASLHKGTAFPMQVRLELDPNFTEKPLAEVADLDNLLGFKGNYAIFPLKHSNSLTDFMMAPYVDPFLGLHDPDDVGNWTLEEWSDYVCRLKKLTAAREFEAMKPQLLEQYKRLLSNPHRQGDELVVPTGSLYIEALPAAHPILEDFKLMHRAIDVKKVQADVRHSELENLRLAARTLRGELEDPDIEKKVVIQGAGQGVTVTPD
jgi:hypothetical protein